MTQIMEIADLGKKKNMIVLAQTAISASTLLFGHLLTSEPGHFGWLCLDWSPNCYILLGSGLVNFFSGIKISGIRNPLFCWVTKAPLKIYSQPRHSSDNTL